MADHRPNNQLKIERQLDGSYRVVRVFHYPARSAEIYCVKDTREEAVAAKRLLEPKPEPWEDW